MTQAIDYKELADNIKYWGIELGFSQIGISDIDLTAHEPKLLAWLDKQYHGEMDYMARHGLMRARPAELEPETIRAISVRLDYLPTNAKFAKVLKNKQHAYVSRYALGRDYHKLMRKRLQQLGDKIKAHCQNFNFRPFVDSAPVLERPLAEKAGLGWVGKHSLLINQQAGSWFFLGELFVNLPLPVDQAPNNECGHCVACLKICPTQAIVEPYVVDARRCISYLTIEHKGRIDEALRPLMGNRIYGCDDCQLICPWNKFAALSIEPDFQPRQSLDDSSLLSLFSWTEKEFLARTEGSPIRRIGFQNWQRNIAIALGNAHFEQNIIQALDEKYPHSDDVVQEHISWALTQQKLKKELAKQLIDVIDVSESKAINTGEKNSRLTNRLIRAVERGLPRDA